MPPRVRQEPAAGARAVDEFGRIESRGIDHIPEADRHGRPRELFAVWLASNTTYLYILLGGALVVLGLSPAQAFGVLLLGNLFWALVGTLAISGPASGTPGSIVTRAMYGVRGNRVVGAGINWLTCIAYEGLNLAVGSLAGFALVESAGVHATVAVKVMVAAAIGLATFALSLYGHATIVRFSSFFTVALGGCVLVLGGFVVTRASAQPAGFTPLHGTALWVAVFTGFTLIAAAPLSWGNGADYARYLPADCSRWRVALFTAGGGWLAAMVLGGIGILAGTVVDMTDPQETMRAILPPWFYTVFLLALVCGSITNNVLTTYSSGLCLQSLGVGASRARTVVIDAVLGGALCAYALAASTFLGTMSDLLALTVTFLGPLLAIYATDIALRRNRYDGPALHDERPGGPFWYRNGVNWAGTSALLAGTAAAALCVNTKVFTGPVASALAGADVCTIAGPLVAVVVYVLAGRRRVVTAR
ncbi:purine-cytosine permease family protein [Pseudonocardia acaciae]|uniref:purine-cytosine permease family protein n=1 Tax=Pseudonocardia acaciae TaxID=551276 RepID=UPI00055F9FEC|nr:cytosine permease [Pseudonocardia acaciae]